MYDQEFVVWIEIRVKTKQSTQINAYPWRTTLPFVPYPGLVLSGLSEDCPVQCCRINAVEYCRQSRHFLCCAEDTVLRDGDELELVESLLQEKCWKKPF